MKKTICLMVCWSLNVLAAAGFSDAAYFDMGQLSIKNKDTFNRSKYACVVHHWSLFDEFHVHQEKGFVGVIMKRDDSEVSGLELLRTCRALALQLQENLTSLGYNSSPLILRYIVQTLDCTFATQAFKSLAVIVGRQRYAHHAGRVFIAKGLASADAVNYVPQFTEIQEIDLYDGKTYELHLPETEDAPDAPIVLWKSKK